MAPGAGFAPAGVRYCPLVFSTCPPLLHAECRNIQRILSDWEPLLACTVERWGESHDGLAAAFEGLRAAQMRGNTQRWLALNPLYPGVAEALRQCPYPFYIASSKASSRLITLLNASLGMSVDEHSPRLFASLIPPNEKKIEALRWASAQAGPNGQGKPTRGAVGPRRECLCVTGLAGSRGRCYSCVQHAATLRRAGPSRSALWPRAAPPCTLWTTALRRCMPLPRQRQT